MRPARLCEGQQLALQLICAHYQNGKINLCPCGRQSPCTPAVPVKWQLDTLCGVVMPVYIWTGPLHACKIRLLSDHVQFLRKWRRMLEVETKFSSGGLDVVCVLGEAIGMT